MVRYEVEHELRTKVYRTLLSDQGRLFSMEPLMLSGALGKITHEIGPYLNEIGPYFKLECTIWRKGFVG